MKIPRILEGSGLGLNIMLLKEDGMVPSLSIVPTSGDLGIGQRRLRWLLELVISFVITLARFDMSAAYRVVLKNTFKIAFNGSSCFEPKMGLALGCDYFNLTFCSLNSLRYHTSSYKLPRQTKERRENVR